MSPFIASYILYGVISGKCTTTLHNPVRLRGTANGKIKKSKCRDTSSRDLLQVSQETDVLSERQRQVIAFVRENGSISTGEYAMQFRISERQARRDLADLIARQALQCLGSGPAIQYVLPD